MDTQNIEMAYSSRAPVTPWFERIDPIHEVEWGDLILSWWEGVNTFNHYMGVDSTGHLYHRTTATWSPVELSDRIMFSSNTIIAMAMLNEWNSLTTFQLSTLLGISKNKTWKLMWNLYSAGLVLRMVPQWWNTSIQASGSGSVWKINRRSLQTNRWFEQIDNLEWALATNGVDPAVPTIGGTSPQALRHNLSMVEIVIKAMEACPAVIGGWGEGHCDSWMFYDQSEYESDDVRTAIADGALVTKDGKVIIFEASGSGSIHNKGEHLVGKAAAWTAICGKSSLDMYVVFVDISRTPNMYHFNKHIRIGIEKASSRYVSNLELRAKGQKRIMVVDSRDWFPIVRGVSEDFMNLRVWSPAIEKFIDLAPVNTELDRSKDVVVNTLASLHTPRWVVDPIPDDEME